MYDLYSTINQSVYQQLTAADFFMNSVLGGAVCIIIILVVIRFTARALIYSWFGKNGGRYISSIIEATALVFIAAAAWRNPGVLITSIAWGALILNSIIRGI